MKLLTLLLCLLISFQSIAEDEEAIPFLDIFRKIPQSYKVAGKKAFNKDALPYWAAIAGSTGLLYIYDEKIHTAIHRQARDWQVSPHYKTHSTFGESFKLLNLPKDIGSMLYFAGDGLIHLTAAATLIAVGKYRNDNYTANTGIMIIHGLTMTGITAQLMKRSFGRESPVEKTHPRGAWHPFPSFHKYQSDTAKYDAMPSGHMMTASLTFTVLASRFTDYEVPIWIAGGVWMSALGFQMVNNGVHWASDYPLGIATGYLIGRSVIKMHKNKDEIENDKISWNVFPSFTQRVPTINAVATF